MPASSSAIANSDFCLRRPGGALPNGRRKGESFASGIAPANGMDKNGPTAMLNSINRIDFTRFANGINLNIKFDPPDER